MVAFWSASFFAFYTIVKSLWIKCFLPVLALILKVPKHSLRLWSLIIICETTILILILRCEAVLVDPWIVDFDSSVSEFTNPNLLAQKLKCSFEIGNFIFRLESEKWLENEFENFWFFIMKSVFLTLYSNYLYACCRITKTLI